VIEIIIMRHGHALSADEDPERGLSPAGRSDTARVARFLAEAGVAVDRIQHSGKKRAAETAEILREKISGKPVVERRRGLSPTDSVEEIASELESLEENVALVGHLPHLNLLLVKLLDSPGAPEFGTSTAVHLRRKSSGWELVALYQPRSSSSSSSSSKPKK